MTEQHLWYTRLIIFIEKHSFLFKCSEKYHLRLWGWLILRSDKVKNGENQKIDQIDFWDHFCAASSLYMPTCNGAKHSPWISWNYSKRSRGQNVTSDVPTDFCEKVFSGPDFKTKNSHWAKTLIQPSSEFVWKTFPSLQKLSKMKIKREHPTNFAHVKV